MNDNRTSLSITIIRWLARAMGLALAGLHGAFFFGHLGEFLDMHGPPPFAAWSAMLLLPIIMSGYLLAWRYEATGAAMAIGGALLLFPRAGAMFPVYAGIASLPAFMHLYCRFATRPDTDGHHNRSPYRARIIMTIVASIPLTIAGLFVLEIFTHHATPYTERTLPGELAGTWTGTGVTHVDPETGDETRIPVMLTIHDDGTVTGTINGQPAGTFSAQKNRTRFYRKINFYTDHLVEGRLGTDIEPGDNLAGELIRMPCNIKDGALRGTIFHITRFSYNPIVNRLVLTRDGPGNPGEE